ncbi:protein HtrL-like [Physella acuta]|uniref:protein HtrL-like n=1 Tax=Physella acuta TaxID=109671 RepID=UPI0027DC63EA|nr:protein HtrL-like [Physella acuta]
MINIGRGKWKNLNRTYEHYLRCFKQVLGLKVNLVLYVDAKAKAFAEEQRRGMESRTHIIKTTLRDTPYYKLYPRMAEIMNSTEYKKDNELFKLNLPEALYPDYVIITWTKLYFIDRTIKENPFKNNFFIWLDGGYGHCAPIFPASHIWRPRGLFEHADKVTFIELGKGIEEFRNVKDKIHKMSIAVINGGFIAGGTSALQKLYSLQNEQVEEWMDHGIVDDEQTVYLTLCYKYLSMFHLVRGTWHDAFKLFNSEK